MNYLDKLFYPAKQKIRALQEYIVMKKSWKKPQLTSFGTIEAVTQMQLDEVVKLGEFIVPSDALGLFASLSLG